MQLNVLVINFHSFSMQLKVGISHGEEEGLLDPTNGDAWSLEPEDNPQTLLESKNSSISHDYTTI